MMNDLKVIREEQRENHTIIITLKKENQELREDIEKLNRRIDEMEEKSNTKNQILERKMFQSEALNRKNNIIIKGLQVESRTATQDVENMMKSNLELNIDIKEVVILETKREQKMIVVKMENMEDKKKVMKAKNKLKGKNIYIEDDMTKEERMVQYELRKSARNIRKTGKEVKIGFQKLIIDGERQYWDSHLNRLVATKNW